MNKKIIISLSIIGVAAAIAIGGTVAYFSDTETSTGNIFVAGTIDLKVDHVKQTYNEMDCKTCSVEIESNTQDQVVATQGGLDPVLMPHDAELVTWIHPSWTASVPGANWIWATDPTIPAEESIDVIYTFQKKFDWWGPITGVTLVLDVGGDNSYEVWLNSVQVAGDNTEQNYTAAGQDQYTDGAVLANVQQGQNTIEFKVKNWARPQGQTWANPGGLLYKLVIDGQCEDNYFKNNCTLWGEKDLVGDEKFFDFDDIKPGHEGTNVISVHVYENDAWMCLVIDNKVDNGNGLIEPEIEAGDTSDGPGEGELSENITLFVWRDNNGDGVYQPGTETEIDRGSFSELNNLSVYDSGTEDLLPACETKYVGIAWCAGTINVNENTGDITCNAAGMGNDCQSDSLSTDITFYAEQYISNPDFICGE